MPLPWGQYIVLARLESKIDKLAKAVDRLQPAQGSDVGEINQKLEKLLQFAQQEMDEMTQLDDNIVALQQTVAADTTVVQSAVSLINGIAQQIADAVAAAMAAGATADELKSLTDLGTSIQGNTQQLADAVQANTPAAPPVGRCP